ncbi:MAG: response regulator [Limisphaerales bacterium]
MARLIVITKGLAALPHDLNDKWITVGRADGNTFQIADPSVSGRHCEVHLADGELIVRDLQSTNGTFVNGKKITEGILKLGETLRLGEVELQLDLTPTVPKPGTAFLARSLANPGSEGATKITVPEPSAPGPITEPKPFGVQDQSTNPEKKFQVLFVDDSMAFLETFTDLCSVLSDQTWEIHTAPTADLALSILQKIPIDLAVLDIGMPMLDGLQLMSIISRRYPAIKIAVMTGNANESKRADSLASGAELFIEKPISPDGIKVVFNMLNDLVSWTHREGFTGALRQVGLQEVIQMECIARHSSILEIRNQHMRGQIFIETGAITHAVAGTLAGEKALNELLSMPGGEFQLKPFKTPPQRTIFGGWEFLLLEAARRSDEDTAMLSRKAVEAAAANNPPPANDSINQLKDASQNPA